MIFLNKNRIKILITLLLLLSATTFCNVAKANTITNGVSNFYSFVNTRIVAQVKNDFCRQYILSISNGDWKAGEFRTNLGKRVCTSYSVPADTTNKIVPTNLQQLNGNTAVSTAENPTTTSINNPAPIVNEPVVTSQKDLNDIQIINLTNIERKNNDASLVNLRENEILDEIAAIRVKDMFANTYFEHVSPTGDDVIKQAAKIGYKYITIGENIALGSFDGSSGVVKAWMDSPGHKANILNKNYTEIGVYSEKNIYNGEIAWLSAQVFAKPIGDCKTPDEVLKTKIDNYKTSAESIANTINSIDAELKIPNTEITITVQSYNSKVAERNTLAKLYNDLVSEIKTLVAEYNSEVTTYNLCVKII